MTDKKLSNEIESYFDRLWPIPRSIMGKGFRDSLDILREIVPFKKYNFKTGEKVFDWVIPKEWSIKEAYFTDSSGKKYADFSSNNLHILNYSSPFEGSLGLRELKKHLFAIPEIPNAIPYLTSYYEERWGFCLSHEELNKLKNDKYKVVINSKLFNGKLQIGEYVLKGKSKKEILFSSYLCHPSLANNELSGPLVLSFLHREIAKIKNRKYTYRFVIVPETIGSLAFLKLRGEHLKKNLIAGYQITCVGDEGDITYKLSRDGDSLSDRSALEVLKSQKKVKIREFDPSIGSDERQYSSPGFNLKIGSLMRTMYTEYPEYHTSLDNKDIINFNAMADIIDIYLEIVNLIEANHIFKNTVLYGEPQLGRRGFFRTLGSQRNTNDFEKAMWWILNLSDGTNDLISIANKSGVNWKIIKEVSDKLLEGKLLKK